MEPDYSCPIVADDQYHGETSGNTQMNQSADYERIEPVPVLDSDGHCSTPYSAAVTSTNNDEIKTDNDIAEQRKIENDVIEAVLNALVIHD